MKLFVVTFAVLIALTKAAVPEPTILNPDFLGNTAWAHQIASHKLIDEIDRNYIDVSTLISTILGTTVAEKLSLYKAHTDDLLNIYDPVLKSLDVLPVDDCRTQVLTLLQSTIGNAGARGGLCVRNYHRDTKTVVDNATDTINELNEDYLKLSKFVYQSFAGKNALIDSEKIEINMNSTFKALVDSIHFDPIDQDELVAALNKVGLRLGTCFDDAEHFASNLIVFAKDQVDVCKDIHDIPRGPKRIFKSFAAEFEEALTSYPEFKW
jgi:hypothetical protein